MELITTITLILTILTNGAICEAAFVYDHMEMVLQWPPTFCGRGNVQCKPTMSSKLNFSIHGLWPADATGNSRQKCPPPPNPNTVKLVWENDRKLREDLDEYWPSLKAGQDNESFWMHEWKVHGYCTEKQIPAADYFRRAVSFAKSKTMTNMISLLKEGGIFARNDKAYKVQDVKALISKIVQPKSNYDVYISCKNNTSHIFLHEIHFCLDTKLSGFISCPPSSDTRGCGGPNQQNLVFPTMAIYRG